MKNLLQKSLKPLTIFAFIVFALSIPIYFLLVEWIWMKELDENNELIAQRIENEFNQQHINHEKLEESITFWNEIQSVGRIESMTKPLQKDSVYTIRRQNPYSKKKAIDRFRGLVTTIRINKNNFTVTIETNVEESEETVGYIAVVTLLFFLILIIGFWILNKRLSQKLWAPFHITLHKLKSFQLNNQTEIQFSETDIIEFQELNIALEKLLRHSIAIYKSQKEFTENASHELQTPLAIIKNKLDVLLQEESLTDRQYRIIEEINRTLTRITRINRNLLLLAKIENHQFDNSEIIQVSQLLRQCIEQLMEHSENKNIRIQIDINDHVTIKGNRTLIEMLINNLLINAIRHNIRNGKMNIYLTNNELIVSNTGTKTLNREKLFERFAISSSDATNSGLGLAIIKEICNHYGWEIDYDFENGFHSFRVTF